MNGDLATWARAQWDRLLAAALILLGALGLAFGYWGVAHARYVPDGLAFVVSGGLGGLFLLGLGATLLVSADLHDEWRKFDEIEQTLRRVEAVLAAAGLAAPPPEPGHAGDEAPPAPENGVPGLHVPAAPTPGASAPDMPVPAAPTPGASAPDVPVLNRFGLLRYGPDGPAQRRRRPAIGAAVALVLAAAALTGGWLLAATAEAPGRAVGGVALAGGAVLLIGVAALVSLGGRRRRLRRRAAELGRGAVRVAAVTAAAPR